MRTRIGLLVILLMNAVAGFSINIGSTASDYRNSYDAVVDFLMRHQYSLSSQGDLFSNGSCHETKFSMPESQLEEFKKRFWWTISLTGEGTFYAHNRGAGQEKFEKTFYYGDNNEKSITFGNKNQNECLAYYATNGNPKQAVYAIAWENSKGVLRGSVYLITGDNMDNVGRSGAKYISDASGFLEEFSKIRTAFKIQGKSTISEESRLAAQTGLANKLLTLCKKYGHLLSQEDGLLYKDAIQDMKNSTTDNFVKGLLDQSLKILSKTK